MKRGMLWLSITALTVGSAGGAQAASLGDILAGGESKKAEVTETTDADFWENYKSQVTQGTVVGAVAGALLGRIIGGNRGMVVGAVAGGAAGNLVGKHYAEITRVNVVSEDNALKLIDEHQLAITAANVRMATLMPELDKLDDEVAAVKAELDAGTMNQTGLQQYKAQLQSKSNLIAADLEETKARIAHLQVLIASAKDSLPDAVPNFEQQLENLQTVEYEQQVGKLSLDDMLATL